MMAKHGKVLLWQLNNTSPSTVQVMQVVVLLSGAYQCTG
jgi:hypothetical protein